MNDKYWSPAEIAQGLREMADWIEQSDRVERSHAGQGIDISIHLANADACTELAINGGGTVVDSEIHDTPSTHSLVGFGEEREGWLIPSYRFPLHVCLVDATKIGVSA